MADGGSGYVGGVPSFKHTNGVTYSSSTTTSSHTGNGTASITFMAFSDPPKNTIDKSFMYTGGMQTYTVPVTGVYKLEVYGAEGTAASWNNQTGIGGKGGYSVGYKVLTKGTVLYVGVGGGGGETSVYLGSVASNYNGGGSAKSNYSSTVGAPGGGCTHIATKNGTLASIGASNLSSVLIVAGGRRRWLSLFKEWIRLSF